MLQKAVLGAIVVTPLGALATGILVFFVLGIEGLQPFWKLVELAFIRPLAATLIAVPLLLIAFVMFATLVTFGFILVGLFDLWRARGRTAA